MGVPDTFHPAIQIMLGRSISRGATAVHPPRRQKSLLTIQQMTRREMLRPDRLKDRFLDAAAIERIRTAGVKAAPFGRIDWARDVALEYDALAVRAGLRHRNGRQQRLRVRMLRRRKNLPL